MKNIERLHNQYGLSDKDYNKARSFAKKLPKNKFIVAVPKGNIKKWISSGLMKEIKYFIKPDYRLEFNILKNCKIFIREHIHQSPKEIKEKYNKKMYMFVPEPYKTDIWLRYFMSTKRLKTEKDLKFIKVPELWLACKIPLDKIKISRVE